MGAVVSGGSTTLPKTTTVSHPEEVGGCISLAFLSCYSHCSAWLPRRLRSTGVCQGLLDPVPQGSCGMCRARPVPFGGSPGYTTDHAPDVRAEWMPSPFAPVVSSWLVKAGERYTIHLHDREYGVGEVSTLM